MGAAIGEGEAEEEGIDAKDFLEALDDGDGAAFANEGGLTAEGLGKGALGGPAEWGVGIGEVGVAVVALDDLDVYAGGGVFAKVIGDLADGLEAGLAGDEAEGEFCEGGVGDDGFCAFALVAAADAVEFDGGAGPDALEGGVAGLAGEGGRASDLEEAGVGEREGGPCLALPVAEGLDGIGETGDGDAALGVVEGSDEAGEGGDGIADGAAVDAGVEIDGGTGDADLDAADATKAVGEGGNAGGDHGGIGDDDDVGAQFGGVGGEEGGEIWAADFFFALDDEEDVDGEMGAGGERGLDTEDVGHDLAFVICSATGGDDATGEAGLEGRGGPEVEGICGLDVVVAVDEDGGAAGVRLGAGEDDGMAGGAADLREEADADKFFVEPLAAGGDVVATGGIGGDAGEAKEVEELVEMGGHGGELLIANV